MKRWIVAAAFLMTAPVMAQMPNPCGRENRAEAGPKRAGLYWLRPEGAVLMRFDANHDGVVTEEEAAQGADAAFAGADSDKDGRLRGLEYADWAERNLGARDASPGFLMLDASGDLSVSPAEFRTGWLEIFHRYDHDRKGMARMGDILEGQSNGAPEKGGGDCRATERRRRPGH